MNLFELTAKLFLDTSEYDKKLKNASEETESFSSNLEKGLGIVAQGVGIAFAATTTAVGKLVKDSVEKYAEYEQLIGGVETLFKNSAARVQEYANQAYKTAGISANQYMETVTSFSASLLQSLGNDTEKAANYADMAIRDMSDNANKMGSDMSSIMAAYQGFAKQNYTLLDNLKLGYGGTKTEMERLITDAEKLNNTFHAARDANGELALSYSDIIDAIHIVQDEMGITGTTAKEASSTILGSISTAEAAWENLVTAFGDGTIDLDSKITDFVDSVQTVGENVLPVAEQVLDGISVMIEKVAPVLSEAIPGIIDKILPPLIEASGKIIGALVVGFFKGLPDLLEALALAFRDFMEALGQWMAPVFMKGKEIIENIANGIAGAANAVVDKASQIIQKFIEGIKNFFGQVKQVGTEIVSNIKEGIASKIEDAKNWGRDLINNFIEGAKETWNSVKGFFSDVGQGIKNILGFSEPKEGPLSNFHTYAPDMMKLYAQGIRDNKYLVTDEISNLAEQMNAGLGLTPHFKSNWNFSGNADERSSGFGGGVSVVQNIYSYAKTEADLMEEAILYQERAVLMGV